VRVEVDDEGAPHDLLAPQGLDGEGDVVEHAEALAMVAKSVMRAAADVQAQASLERQARGREVPRGERVRLHRRARPWQLHHGLLVQGERAGAGAADPIALCTSPAPRETASQARRAGPHQARPPP